MIKHQQRIYTRWLIQRDLPEVLEIHRACFGNSAWDEDLFRDRSVISTVAENVDDRIVGVMVYRIDRKRFHLLTFAVHPDFRRLGVGAQMLTKLIGKLSSDRRSRITLEVRETNLSAQLFYRSQGFKAVRVLRSFCMDTGEDAYQMEYRL